MPSGTTSPHLFPGRQRAVVREHALPPPCTRQGRGGPPKYSSSHQAERPSQAGMPGRRWSRHAQHGSTPSTKDHPQTQARKEVRTLIRIAVAGWKFVVVNMQTRSTARFIISRFWDSAFVIWWIPEETFELVRNRDEQVLTETAARVEVQRLDQGPDLRRGSKCEGGSLHDAAVGIVSCDSASCSSAIS